MWISDLSSWSHNGLLSLLWILGSSVTLVLVCNRDSEQLLRMPSRSPSRLNYQAKDGTLWNRPQLPPGATQPSHTLVEEVCTFPFQGRFDILQLGDDAGHSGTTYNLLQTLKQPFMYRGNLPDHWLAKQSCTTLPNWQVFLKYRWLIFN